MNNEEIEKLLKTNSEEKLNNLLNQLCIKADKIDQDNRRVGIYMVLLIAIISILDIGGGISITLDVININDAGIIKKLAPLAMAILIFKLALNNSHQVTLNRVIQNFSSSFYGYSEHTTDKRFIDSLTRMIVPLSFSYELTKFLNKERWGIWTAIITLVIALIVVLGPVYFNLAWLYELIKNHGCCATDIMVITSATILLLLLTLWYFIQTLISDRKRT